MTWKVDGKVTLAAEQFELWYDEDLTGGTESDNWGTACDYLQIDFQYSSRNNLKMKA